MTLPELGKRFTVVGGGFGLYGYVVALLEGNLHSVALPFEYRPRMEARPELAHLIDRINWRSNFLTCLESSDSLVMAVPPLFQKRYVDRLVELDLVPKSMFLEKPLGRNSQAAEELLQTVSEQDVDFRIAFLFWYAEWSDLVVSEVLQDGEILIEWKFSAHHYRNFVNTWKRHHSLGGGVLHFYAVHLVAFFAKMGFDGAILHQVSCDEMGEPVALSVEFSHPKLRAVCVLVDSNSTVSSFEIFKKSAKQSSPKLSLFRSISPFLDASGHDAEVGRIEILKRYLHDTHLPMSERVGIYRNINSLVGQLEAQLPPTIPPLNGFLPNVLAPKTYPYM